MSGGEALLVCRQGIFDRGKEGLSRSTVVLAVFPFKDRNANIPGSDPWGKQEAVSHSDHRGAAEDWDDFDTLLQWGTAVPAFNLRGLGGFAQSCRLKWGVLVTAGPPP